MLFGLMEAGVAQAPSFSWATKGGGPSQDYVRGLASDGMGNTYVAGNFYQSATFGNITLTGDSVDQLAFIAKYNSSGTVVWAKSGSISPRQAYAYGAAADNLGNVFIVGASAINFPDMFVTKYDSAGNVTWTRRSASPPNTDVRGTGIAVGPDGSVYVTGFFEYGSATFGTNTVGSAGQLDVFLAKYDSAGTGLWARRAGGLYDDSGSCITVDPQGNVLLGGMFSLQASFGGIALNGSGDPENFIAKCDSQGNFQWAKRIGGASFSDSRYQSYRGIAADSQGNAYFVGSFNSTSISGFVAKFDSLGAVMWMRSMAAGPASVAVDAFANVYFGGSFGGSVTLDSQTLTSAGGNDTFVFKLNNSGTAIWAKQAGFVFDDICNGVAVDPAGNVLLAGYFHGTTKFDTNTISGNGDDAFVAKLGNNTVPLFPVIQSQPQNQSVSPGATVTFGVVASGAPPLQFQWRFNGTNIASATNALLTITNALLANAGSYDVVASNAAGSTNSAVATLTVLPGTPNFADNFADRGIMIGFTNYVTGNSSLYTEEPGEPAHADRKGAHSGWLTWTAPDNGSCVMDTLGSSFDTVLAVYTGLAVSNMTLVAANDDVQPGTLQSRVAFSAAAGVAYQIAVDGYAAADSGNIVFHMSFSNSIPIITAQPQNRSVLAGTNTTFAITALGVQPLNYQWRFNGSDLADATNASYTINNVQPANAGSYAVVVANSYGSVTSVVVTLTVFRRPAIAFQPQNVTVTAGDSAAFNVSASGTPPLSYQWRFNGSDIAGAFSASLTISNTQPAQAGPYIVVVSNPYGSITSAVATLAVNFSLMVNTNGNGSVSRNPNQGNYAPNSLVNLTATPGAGAFFVNWSGDASGTTNPLPVTMTSNKLVTANFAATSLLLSAQGSGTIGKSPDRAFYSLGEQVTLTTTASRWYAFNHWLDGSTANPRVVVIGPSNSYTAIFTPTQPLETLTFGGISRTAPVGMPAVFVDGVFIVAGGVTNFDAAQVELVSSLTNETILFSLDDSTPGLSSTYYEGPFMLRQDATVRAAAFTADLTQSVESDPIEIVIVRSETLTVRTAGGGAVTRSPDAARYVSGSEVALSAAPDPGWTFVQWLGDLSGANPEASLTLSRDKCVEAVFGTTLSMNALGNGSVLVTPQADIYPYGTVALITAVPQAGNYFAFWGSAASGTNDPLNFSVTNAQSTVTAVFQPLSAGQFALAVIVDGFGLVTNVPRGNRFTNNAHITLKAIPDADQQFLGWSGDANGTQDVINVVMSQSRIITAQFTKRPSLTFPPCVAVNSGEDVPVWLTGGWGAIFGIESAPTLDGPWASYLTLTNQFGRTQWLAPRPTNESQRFYRAVRE